jgi:rRNA processing protein Krr1/Pno1
MGTPIPFSFMRGSPKQIEFARRALEDWCENNPKKTRFHNMEEWHAFYNELKASEHEERNGR